MKMYASFLVYVIMIQGLEMILFLHVRYYAMPHADETKQTDSANQTVSIAPLKVVKLLA